MPLHYYEELDVAEARAFELHLASCPACAAEWTRTRHALDGVDADAAFPREAEVDWVRLGRDTIVRARRAEAYGRAAEAASIPPWVRAAGAGAVWAGGRAAVDWLRRAASAATRIPVPARWGIAAVAGAVTLMMMLQGTPEGPGAPGGGGVPFASGPGEAARFIEGSVARQGAARYLVDSRALLVNLVEAPVPCRRTDGDFDIRMEKQRARELLRRKNLYEGSLGGLENGRLAGLVRQLESILLQVSSLDDCATARQIHDLSQAVERRQILLRIDLVTHGLREEGARV
jgi:hypothetical protein